RKLFPSADDRRIANPSASSILALYNEVELNLGCSIIIKSMQTAAASLFINPKYGMSLFFPYLATYCQ
ncbi:hypothetical protein, partial [Pseudomonas aeruginosa]|uniref:hypothetical protein n=1 Tax=Pseudomonas aeruginosa TaxID=287 RepID=UPI0040447E40